MELSPDIITALDMMWKGMLGIFAVIGIIALIVYFLGKIANQQ